MKYGCCKCLNEFYFQTLILPYSHIVLCGSSSVGRAIAFQAIGRGFEPRLPLLVTGALAKVVLSNRSFCEDGPG